jgi:6-phosphogluconate dehydrogenase
MKTQQYEIGMVGLGVIGRNLLLNMAEQGHSVVGYDKDAGKVAALRQEAENRDVRGAADIKEFIALLHQPRAVMMLVATGPPVDSVISAYERIDAKGTFHTECVGDAEKSQT